MPASPDDREQYAVRTLRRYGLEKFASDPSLLGRLGAGAKWLFSRHPNTHTHMGMGPATYREVPGLLWGTNRVPSLSRMYQELPGRGPGLVNALKDHGQAWGDLVRDIYLGSPVDAWKSFQQHKQNSGSTLGGLGRFAKEYYWHPQSGGFMNALGVAATGYDLYRALTGDPSQRRGDMAAALTGAAIAPVTGHMGALLGAPIHLGVIGLARRLGHKFDPPATGESQPTPYAPRLDPRGHTRRWLRTSPNVPYLGEGFPEMPDLTDLAP